MSVSLVSMGYAAPLGRGRLEGTRRRRRRRVERCRKQSGIVCRKNMAGTAVNHPLRFPGNRIARNGNLVDIRARGRER